MRYVLGLDLGPSSIGWAAVKLDNEGNYIGLADIPNGNDLTPAIGVRIFPAGIENINQGQREEPKNKKRREARSVRRMLRRRRARRLKLLVALTANNLMPSDIKKKEEILSQDPYKLRDKAVSEKINLFDIGRIFLHIAKRRGFLSNRKQTEKDKDAGLVKEAIERLANESGNKTLGQFWSEKLRENPFEAIRNRRSNYHWIAQRMQYEYELNKIWDVQAKFYPDILKDNFKKLLFDILFKQIDFELSNLKKRKVVGTCTLIAGKPRLSMASRKAQEFRLLQKINDMKVYRKGKEIPFDKEKLYQELMVSSNRDFKQIRKLLGLEEDDRINQEHSKSNKLIGNQIDAILSGNKFFGKKEWLKLDETQKENIWKEIQRYINNSRITSEQLLKNIKEKYELEIKDKTAIEKLSEPQGNLSYCEQAIDKILPFMRQGKGLYESIEAAKFVKGWTQQKMLPLPSRENGINIPNPIVTTVMFQLRKIVNALIREIGKPEKIVIEFARDLKASKDLRKEIIEEQNENQKDKEDCIKRIREYHKWDEDVKVSPVDVLKYRLWQQQKEVCPYSLRKIGIEKLLSTETEVDHILPYSMSLDNSMHNKIVCYSGENQTKGQNTPIDWLGETSEKFKKLADAIDKGEFNFDKAKRERFFVHNEEIAERYTPDRLLQDTSYIAREVRSYLKRLYSASDSEKCVKTTKGGITAELRNLWGLNAILRDGELGPKNRDDLRHHAVDAAIIAVTEPGIIKKITEKLKDNWPKRPSRARVDEPWNGFGVELAKAIEKINISHKVLRKVNGALHKETNYWKELNECQQKGKFITRKELNGNFTNSWAEQICDNVIKQLVKNRLLEFGNDPKKAFAEDNPLYLENENGKPVPIRKVRVWQTSSNMIQIRPNIWVEPGSNHHIEIFETKDKKGNTKYEGELVTTFEAYKRKISGEPIIQMEHEPDKKFIMSLSQNEMFILKLEDGLEVLHRVQKMSQSKGSISLIFRPHTYGGAMSDYDKPPLIQRKSPSTLFGRKVTVDPLGRIRWAND